MEKTAELAKGRWREILPWLGVPKRFLTGRNGPCPICKGKDRFKFDDRTKRGDYFCRQCGAGLGIKLVMKVNGWDFKTAARAIDGALGYRPMRDPPMDQAHRAARAFFNAMPDLPQDTTSGAALNILMDENISFDNAMELVSRFAPKRVPKSTQQATLWLRRFHPEKLESWLEQHTPEVRWWLETQT